MTVIFKLEDGEKIGQQFKTRTKKFSEKMIKATQAAARRAAENIESTGREDIAAGGNFGSARWQDGFRAKISYKSRTDINIRVTHSVKYWRVFEYGAVIKGKPLLWIPLGFAHIAAGVRARDFPEQLFRIDRPGRAPLLVSKSGPKYFGKESVTIPKKWHLRQVVRDVTREIKQYYREAMKSNG